MIFKKKPLSQELKLEQILLDINNIAYANPNAALSQLRTFIEVYANGVLIYEDKESDLDLLQKINLVGKVNLLTECEIDIMHQIRKTGNNAVHTYYYSKEEVLTYIDSCSIMYDKFIRKYEKDRVNYNKKLMKSYLQQVENKESSKDLETEIPAIEKNYKGRLISESSVISPKEDFNLENLDEYEYVKNRILKNIEDVNCIGDELQIIDEELIISKDKLEKNKFNLVVLGEFNRGKSTFLNALMGKVILPSDILPTTSVITRISYGKESQVKVTLNNKEEKYIKSEELVSYVTSLDGNDSSHIEITDIYHPIKLCKNGCIITDTPGVNDLNEQNIIITENYIPQADAVIFMMDTDQVLTQSEKHFIKNKVLKNDINKIFFVVNKFDSINKNGVEDFKKYVYSTLEELDLDMKVYFISSKKSLISKIHNTEDEYLKEFEVFSKELEEFLINEKGKYLLLNGCNRLKNSIDNTILNIYEIEADIAKNIDKLEADYLEFKNISDKVKLNKDNIMKDIDDKYFNFKSEVKKMVHDELVLSFNKFITEINNQDMLDEHLYKDLEIRINTNINKWINTRVNPFVLSKINQINEDLKLLLSDSLKYISQSNNYDISEKSTEITIVQSSKFELPTCYNTTYTSSEDGLNTFVGAGAIITMLFTGTLLSGIGGAFLGLIAHEMFGQKSITTTIKSKDEIIKGIEKEKNKAINSIIKEIENRIDKSYKQNCNYIDNSIENVLTNTSNRMSSILNEKKNQNNNMDFVIDNLNSYLNKLYIIKKHNQIIINSLEG